MTAQGSFFDHAGTDPLYRRTAVLDLCFDVAGDVTIVLTSDHVLQERERIVQERKQRLHDPWETDRIPLEQLIPGGDVRIKASSAVLKHNSPVFQLFFRHDSLHTRLLRENGHVEFVDEDVSPQAFHYFMDIFYNNHDDVPGSSGNVRLEFDVWLEAMVIMDKYDFHKSALLYKRAWWLSFQPQLPTDLPTLMQRLKNDPNFDIRSWISIAFVMGKHAELNLLLDAYKLGLAGFPAADFHLPLPEKLQAAEKQRLAAIASVNGLLVDYFQSATQWSPDPICKCNRKQDARKCDKEVYERLAKSYKQHGWLVNTKTNRSGTSSQFAVQLDPSKVTFSDLRNRTARMKNFPHHCEGIKKHEMSQKMVEYFAMANQDLYGQLDIDLDHASSVVESWLQPQPNATQCHHGFGYKLSTPTLPHLNRPFDTQVPQTLTPQLRARHRGGRQPCSRRGWSSQPSRATGQSSNAPTAGDHSHGFGSMPNPVPPLSQPPSLFGDHASSFFTQRQQLQVSQQARFQAQRNTQMLSAYRDATHLANTAQSQGHSGGVQTVANAIAVHPSWDSGFGSMNGDFLDSAIDLTADFTFDIEGSFLEPGGSGKTATSPINVEGYQAKAKEDDNTPVDMIPCNPSPFQTILSQLAIIEGLLMCPTPDFKQPEWMDLTTL